MEISPSFFKNGEKLWCFLLSDPIQQITKRKGEISMLQKRKSSPYINMLIFFQFGHSKLFWEKYNGDFSILAHPIQHIAHLQKNEEILPCKTCCCFLNLERQNVFRTTKICLQSSENEPIQQFFLNFITPKRWRNFNSPKTLRFHRVKHVANHLSFQFRASKRSSATGFILKNMANKFVFKFGP